MKTGSGLRIISWNVNGIRARIDAVKRLVNIERPDILCLQEIRSKVPHRYLDAVPGYGGIAAIDEARPSRGGVAVLVRQEILEDMDPDHIMSDKTGHILGVDIYGTMIFSIYSPAYLQKKIYLIRQLESCLDQCRCVLCGDFNSITADIDRHRLFIGRENCLPIDKYIMTYIMKSLNLKDPYRELYPRSRSYTFWPYTDRCRERNIGMRIDYTLISTGIPVLGADILGTVRGSDHCPVSVKICLN